MTEWKTYRLGDVCSRLRSGNGIPASEVSACGKFAVVGGNGVRGYTDKSNFNGQCVVVGRQGAYCGNVRYFDGEFYMTEHAVVIVGNEYADTHFLAYLLSIMELGHLSAQSAQPGLSVHTLSKLEISLPPLEEQRRIAGILGAIDDKIENNRRINTNLELQAQALYKQWFVDFEFPNEEGKPYKSSGGKMVDSDLGPIPEGWSVGKLEDIGDIIGGGTPSKVVTEYYTMNGIAWITPKDLSVSHLKFTAKGETDITELGYKNSSAKIMPRGSVLFSSRAPIGYISIAKNDICTNQGFKSVVPNNGYTAFVYYFLLSNTENIESKATGSTFKEASGALMKSLDLVIPSEDILEKFETIMSPIFESQETFEAENITLATLRDTLLPKLMNGEIITK